MVCSESAQMLLERCRDMLLSKDGSGDVFCAYTEVIILCLRLFDKGSRQKSEQSPGTHYFHNQLQNRQEKNTSNNGIEIK